MNIERVVVWFSAGVTSAIAAKLARDKFSSTLPVHLVNTDTGSEDDDNYRFMDDVAAWLSLPLEIIRSIKYADTFAVYDDAKFFKNQYGARCTVELKKIPRRKYENLETDLQVFGFDADERRRADDFQMNNPEINAYFPLIEAGISKGEARSILLSAGIREPRTCSEGFNNANCLKRGCVKGGIGYWNHIRKVRPEVFWSMARKEREIGFAICAFEKIVDGKRTKVPVFLDELPQGAGNYSAEPAIQCSLFCSIDTQ